MVVRWRHKVSLIPYESYQNVPLKGQTCDSKSFSYSTTFSTNDNPSFIDFSNSDISASFAAISSFTLLKISLKYFFYFSEKKMRGNFEKFLWKNFLGKNFNSYAWWKFSSRYSHTKSLSFNSSIFINLTFSQFSNFSLWVFCPNRFPEIRFDPNKENSVQVRKRDYFCFWKGGKKSICSISKKNCEFKSFDKAQNSLRI